MRAAHTHASYLACARSLGLRFLLLLVTWFVIAEGDVDSFVVGAPLALVAAAASVAIRPVPLPSISLFGLVRFGTYFAVQSVRGGIDVALRAYRPSLPIDPVCVHYRLRLQEPLERVVFANTLSLLPGTLSAGFDGDTLVVHALDRTQPVLEGLQAVERRVADLFGHPVGQRQAGEA